jgi:hypothetical protein
MPRPPNHARDLARTLACRFEIERGGRPVLQPAHAHAAKISPGSGAPKRKRGPRSRLGFARTPRRRSCRAQPGEERSAGAGLTATRRRASIGGEIRVRSSSVRRSTGDGIGAGFSRAGPDRRCEARLTSHGAAGSTCGNAGGGTGSRAAVLRGRRGLISGAQCVRAVAVPAVSALRAMGFDRRCGLRSGCGTGGAAPRGFARLRLDGGGWPRAGQRRGAGQGRSTTSSALRLSGGGTPSGGALGGFSEIAPCLRQRNGLGAWHVISPVPPGPWAQSRVGSVPQAPPSRRSRGARRGCLFPRQSIPDPARRGRRNVVEPPTSRPRCAPRPPVDVPNEQHQRVHQHRDQHEANQHPRLEGRGRIARSSAVAEADHWRRIAGPRRRVR